FLFEVRPGRGEAVVVTVRIDVSGRRYRGAPHGATAHLDGHRHRRRVDAADLGIECHATVCGCRSIREQVACGQGLHHGVVVVRLDEYRPHVDAGRVIGGLDVVASPGKRAGTRVGVKVDGAVENLE